MFLTQANIGKTLYFNGLTGSSTWYLATSESKAEAVKMYVEAVDGVAGAYKLYFYLDGAKTYVELSERQDAADPGYGKGTIKFVTSTELYYTYDEAAKTLVYTDAEGDDTYYLGTYNTYDTFSANNYSYIAGDKAANIGVSQFPAQFVLCEDVEEKVEKLESVSVTLDTSISMNFYVSGYDNSSSYYMVFTMNGVASEHIVGVEKDGYLVFTLSGIAPECMGDKITAQLYVDGNAAPVAGVDNYSVKAYAERLIADYNTDGALMDLVADMLRYGAAAQIYNNYKTSDLVTDNLNTGDVDLSLNGSSALPTEDDKTSIDVDASELENSFVGAGVELGAKNKIYVKFKADDLNKIQLTVNGLKVDVAEKVVALGDGAYVLYTGAISPMDFDRAVTFKMYVDGELYQIALYSVNGYAYEACDPAVSDGSTLTPEAQLARALYRYGVSCEAYAK